MVRCDNHTEKHNNIKLLLFYVFSNMVTLQAPGYKKDISFSNMKVH